jgi:hypothetical protein
MIIYLDSSAGLDIKVQIVQACKHAKAPCSAAGKPQSPEPLQTHLGTDLDLELPPTDSAQHPTLRCPHPVPALAKAGYISPQNTAKRESMDKHFRHRADKTVMDFASRGEKHQETIRNQ